MHRSPLCKALLVAALIIAALPFGSRGDDSDNAPTDRVVLVVYLPTEDAKLSVSGAATTTTGAVRRLLSPVLDPAKSYLYTFQTTWTENGKEMTREATVRVKAGQTAIIKLDTGDAVAGAPTPPADPAAKKEPTPEPKKEPAPVAKTEPKKEPAPVAKVEPKAEPKKEPAPVAKVEPKVEPKKEPAPVAKVEPKVEPKKEPAPVAKVEPKVEPKKEPAPVAKVEPKVEPKKEPAPVAKVEPKVEPKKEPAPVAKVEPKKEPAPVAKVDPKTEPAPVAKTEKPAVTGLKIDSPPTLELQVGGFPRLLPVRLERGGIEGPVTIKFENLPQGVIIREAVIPAGESRVDVPTTLLSDVSAGEADLKVSASAGDSQKTETTVKLKVSK